MNRIISSLGVLALLVLYCLSESPSRDVMLVAAIIVAIRDAADRIINRSQA